MKRLAVLAAAVCALAWAATPTTTIAELITMARAGMQDPDASFAKELRKARLSEQLDFRVIEELESEGLGAKSVEELFQLRDASRNLKPPAAPLPFVQPEPPTLEELRQVLSSARTLALEYNKSLPDFICTQIVKRFDSFTGAWRPNDTLEVRLSYFDQKEDYKLLSINGRSTTMSFGSVGGALSQGEFGSLLGLVFESKSKAEFHWAHWSRLRKRTVYVFSFSIRPENSSFHLDFQRARNTQRFSTVPGQRGLVWVDKESNRILRIYAEAYQIAPNFPVRSSSSLLDYDTIRSAPATSCCRSVPTSGSRVAT